MNWRVKFSFMAWENCSSVAKYTLKNHQICWNMHCHQYENRAVFIGSWKVDTMEISLFLLAKSYVLMQVFSHQNKQTLNASHSSYNMCMLLAVFILHWLCWVMAERYRQQLLNREMACEQLQDANHAAHVGVRPPAWYKQNIHPQHSSVVLLLML